MVFKMHLKLFDNTNDLAKQAVEIICQIVCEKPDATLCFACGETPLPVMNGLIECHQKGTVDFSKVRLIGLDEWIGVGRKIKGSCAQMLYDDFFTPMAFRENQIMIFDGLSTTIENDINNINTFIDKNGIDFLLLGIGMNGHIGLNEPGVDPNQKAHVVELSATTKKVMSKYFSEDFEIDKGITLGFLQLLNARNIIMMATGERKAKIVKQIIEQKPNPQLPASLLKLSNNETLFFVDKQAASLLD